MEFRSSARCDARSEGRTQGATVSVDTGATEDAVLGASSAARRLSAVLRQVLLTTPALVRLVPSRLDVPVLAQLCAAPVRGEAQE